jgi:hypothetical protein
MALVLADRSQALRVLDGRFSIAHDADHNAPLPTEDWLALVNGPDGRTIIQRHDGVADGVWAAFWSGDEPHDPETTGMLSAIVAPLADSAMPVMVASTFHADLVLVLAERLDEAISALRAAGHRVTE